MIFPTFGLPGADLDSYLTYLRTREYMQDIWAASAFGDEVRQEAEAVGLDLLRPVPEYGRIPELAI